MTTLPFTIDGEDLNHAFASSIDQVAQYKEVWLSIWLGIVAISDQVVAACTGAASPVRTGSNPITTVANVNIGLAGSQNHSWGIVRLGVDYIVWETNASNVSAVPQNASLYTGTSTYATAGSQTTRDAAVTAGRENAVLTQPLVGWVTPQLGYYNRQYSTSEKQLIFFSKVTGNGGAASAFNVFRTDAANLNGGDAPSSIQPRMYVYFHGAANNTSLSSGQLGTASNWRCSSRDLTSNGSNAVALCHAWFFTNWSNGQDSASHGEPFPIFVGSNAAAAAARSGGFMRWLRGVPTAMPQNNRTDETTTTPPTPSDTHTWWSFDDIALLWPKATGDIA